MHFLPDGVSSSKVSIFIGLHWKFPAIYLSFFSYLGLLIRQATASKDSDLFTLMLINFKKSFWKPHLPSPFPLASFHPNIVLPCHWATCGLMWLANLGYLCGSTSCNYCDGTYCKNLHVCTTGIANVRMNFESCLTSFRTLWIVSISFGSFLRNSPSFSSQRYDKNPTFWSIFLIASSTLDILNSREICSLWF